MMGTPRLLHQIHHLVFEWSLRSVLLPDSVVQQAGVLVRSWCECGSILRAELLSCAKRMWNGSLNSCESNTLRKRAPLLPVHFQHFPTVRTQSILSSAHDPLEIWFAAGCTGAPKALHIVDSKGISCVTCEGSWRRSIYEASSEDMSCQHGNQFSHFVWKSWTWSFKTRVECQFFSTLIIYFTHFYTINEYMVCPKEA